MSFHRSIAAALAAAVLACQAFAAAPPLTQDGTPGGQAPAPEAKAPGDPFLWRIEGNGVTGYLLGTVHLPDPRVLELASPVEAAFRDADHFYAEIDANNASKKKIAGLAVLPAGKTLTDVAGPMTWERVAARMRAKKVPPSLIKAFSTYQPWAITALLPTLDYLVAQASGVGSLDEALYARAAREGKKVHGLETVEEQVEVFTSFTEAEQVTLLRETLDQLDRDEAAGRNTVEETVVAWLSGDEKRLVDLLDDGFGSDPKLRARAEDELLWKRNLRFADRIHAALQAHPAEVAMFAVGALHLPEPPPAKKDVAPAPDDPAADTADGGGAAADADAAKTPERVRQAGLVKLLREKGYVLTRVRAPRRAKTPVGAGK